MMIVYVLTNPAMPGLVKIGYTDSEDANARITALYSTGVPVPFKLEFACRVENAEEVEKALHIAFAPNRINPRREFFEIDPEQAIAILKLLHVDEATTEVDQQPSDLDEQSIVARNQLTYKYPKLNFEEMGIPIGAVLQSADSDATVTVLNAKKVKFGDETMSLTKVTRIVLDLNYNVRPVSHWTYLGRSLADMYNEIYDNVE
jgi:hypothetical protein